jgi:subtilisin family serine protease
MAGFSRFFAVLSICALFVQAAEGASRRSILNASANGPARYIVALNDDADDSVADELTRKHRGRITHRFNRALHGFVVEMPEAAARKLLDEAAVRYVEQDSMGSGGATPVSLATQTAPANWGLDRIDQRSLPLDQTYGYKATGHGVTAYILDSGINATHVEFGGRARSGFNFPSTLPPSDCNGHGTHVAGIVGSSVHGVAKDVSLVSLRVLDCQNRGFVSDMVAGIEWAIADHQSGQPAVMNVSIYTDAPSVSFDNAINAAIADGITVCVLAGNGTANNSVATDACSISPARVTNAITVSATTIADAKASFANFGSCVDLFAPGVQIESTWIGSDTAVAFDSGTSMSTPHVTGAAALYLEDHPTASPGEVAYALIASASLDKVSGAGTGSLNRLLFTGVIEIPPRRRAARP